MIAINQRCTKSTFICLCFEALIRRPLISTWIGVIGWKPALQVPRQCLWNSVLLKRLDSTFFFNMENGPSIWKPFWNGRRSVRVVSIYLSVIVLPDFSTRPNPRCRWMKWQLSGGLTVLSPHPGSMTKFGNSSYLDSASKKATRLMDLNQLDSRTTIWGRLWYRRRVLGEKPLRALVILKLNLFNSFSAPIILCLDKYQGVSFWVLTRLPESVWRQCSGPVPEWQLSW